MAKISLLVCVYDENYAMRQPKQEMLANLDADSKKRRYSGSAFFLDKTSLPGFHRLIFF